MTGEYDRPMLSPEETAQRLQAIEAAAHERFDTEEAEAKYAYTSREGEPAILTIGEVSIVCGEHIAPAPFQAVMALIRQYRQAEIELRGAAEVSEAGLEVYDRAIELGKAALQRKGYAAS